MISKAQQSLCLYGGDVLHCGSGGVACEGMTLTLCSQDVGSVASISSTLYYHNLNCLMLFAIGNA